MRGEFAEVGANTPDVDTQLSRWVWAAGLGRSRSCQLLVCLRIQPATPGGPVQPLPGSRRDAARSNASTDV